MAIVAGIADVAWTQGDAVWTMYDNRLLKGFEYSAKYNASYVESFPDQPTPWEPTGTNIIQRLDRSGRWYSKKVNPYVESDFTRVSRGEFLDNKRPIYEQAVAHFGTRLGLSTNDYLWTLRSRDIAIDHDGYETTPALAWIADQPGWGAVTFRRPALTAGDPVSGFAPGGTPLFAVHQLSGTVEAENYDWFADDGEGRTYHDLSPTNSGGAYRSDAVDIATMSGGGYCLTDIEDGEWVSYTVHVPATGQYGIQIRYAAAGSGGNIHFTFGEDVATVTNTLLSTGSLTNWTTVLVAQDIGLSAGVQSMRAHFGGTSHAYRLDSISVVPVLSHSITSPYIHLSWPTNHPDWMLETSINLQTGVWDAIPGTDVTNEWMGPTDSGSAFFRLANP
jgi:hypothetical protein